MRIILKWLIAAGAILLASYFVPGIHVAGYVSALLAALVLGIFSITIKPVVKLLTLPLTLITLGLFSLALNAAFFWLISLFVEGFTVDGFWAALLGSLIVSVINHIGDSILDTKDADE